MEYHPPTGVSRRGFLQLSGAGLVAAAVLAACGDDDSGSASTTTTTRPDHGRDVRILRTATSLELLHVEIYAKAVDSTLVATAAAKEALTAFGKNHGEHAELFATETTQLGGERYEQPNPALTRMLESRLNGLTDEKAILTLAWETERTAAATYQSYVGQFSDDQVKLNQVVMSVGAIAARHAAILAGLIGQPPVPAAFQATDGAVAAGTGI